MIEEVPQQEPGVRVLTSERGKLTIRQPTKSVIVFVEEGYLEAGYASYITNANNALLAVGVRPHIFVDAAGLTGYDPEIQSSAMAWLKANQGRVKVQHMLVQSRVTQMGLSIVSILLRGIVKGYTSRQEFEHELEKAIRETSEPEIPAATGR